MEVLNNINDEELISPTINADDYAYNQSDDDDDDGSLQSHSSWSLCETATIVDEDLYLQEEITEKFKTIDGDYVTETVHEGTNLVCRKMDIQLMESNICPWPEHNDVFPNWLGLRAKLENIRVNTYQMHKLITNKERIVNNITTMNWMMTTKFHTTILSKWMMPMTSWV